MWTFLSFLILSSLIAHASSDIECQSWFKAKKIKTGNGCLVSCASSDVDFNSLGCNDQCASLCGLGRSEEFLFRLSDLYPGLTKEERALASAQPSEALKAYRLSWQSEKLCASIYPQSRTNDESDACRHFVWAGLMQRELGAELSSKILNAHESDPKQPENEKAMDMANNRLGQLEAQQLIKIGKSNNNNILESFKENLKKNRFIIIKRRATTAGELK